MVRSILIGTFTLTMRRNINISKVHVHCLLHRRYIIPVARATKAIHEALGTQDYRYGLPVSVIGITAKATWTSTVRGLEIGGPKGFGFDDLEYKPLGKSCEPRSVIDEYQVS